jgi:hypothetical protein
MTAPQPYGVAPPPAEALAVAYFTPLMAPLPVSTRLPVVGPRADTAAPALRVEAAGGFLRQDELLYDMSIILHSYAPTEAAEPAAEQTLATALGYGARGVYTFTVTAAGTPWYVTHSWVTAAPLKQNDPLVNMPRYRAMLTWRIPGVPVAMPVGAPATADPPRRGKVNTTM